MNETIKITAFSIILVSLIFLFSVASIVGDFKLNEKLLSTYSHNIDALNATKQIFASFSDFSAVNVDSFTATENSHLDDVVFVLRSMSYAALILLLLWVFMFVYNPQPVALVIGSVFSIVILGVVYFVPFDVLFSYIHKPFFSSGSWEFSASSLLIQTYPIQYWQALGISIGLRVLIFSIFLLLTGIFALLYKKYK